MGSDQKYDFIEKQLSKRRRQDRHRSLRVLNPVAESGAYAEFEGKQFVNFSSNDYLGLSGDPRLKEKANEYIEQYGTGSTASRLICGTYDIHQNLETKLANLFDVEAALVFNTGFQANSSIVGTLTTRNSLILADKRSHNSILQGAILSRAKLLRFSHNDLQDLEDKLVTAADRSYDRIVIMTESVFSMDGDGPDLDELIDLSQRHQAFLFIDEAHAVGIWGDQGRGLSYGKEGVDLRLGTFGKAFGSFGAFVLCSRRLKEYLVNFCPGFIYTTALPPAVIGANEASLEIVPMLEDERQKLHNNVRYLREALNERGYETGSSTSQIIPVIIGSDREALALQEHLESNGILATAIRPPTVPRGKSRIRITLSSRHKKTHLKQFLELLDEWEY